MIAKHSLQEGSRLEFQLYFFCHTRMCDLRIRTCLRRSGIRLHPPGVPDIILRKTRSVFICVNLWFISTLFPTPRTATSPRRAGASSPGIAALTAGFSPMPGGADDVVVAAEDHRVIDRAQGLAFEQGAQLAGGVHAHVRGQFIPPEVGQVINEQLVAKMIFAFAVDPVGFERIAAVGAEHEHAPACAQHACHLRYRFVVVHHVLDNLVAQDGVELAVFERQVLSSGAHQIRIFLLASSKRSNSISMPTASLASFDSRSRYCPRRSRFPVRYRAIALRSTAGACPGGAVVHRATRKKVRRAERLCWSGECWCYRSLIFLFFHVRNPGQ